MSQIIRNMFNKLSLESRQKVNNRVASTNHRANLPVRRGGSDSNDIILKGASLEAARRAYGNISEEEVLEKLSRELRAQKRVDETTTMSDVARRYEQAENTLRDAPPAELAGIGLQEDRMGAFGDDQSDLQMTVEADRDSSGNVKFMRGTRDDNTIRIREDTWDPSSDMIDVSVDPNKPTPAGLVEAFKTRDFGMFQPSVTSSNAGVIDAMDTLNAAAASAGGFDKLPLSASGERAIDVSDSLEDSIGYNRNIEGVESRNLINAENARVTPAMRAAAAEDRQLSALIRRIRQPISDVETAGSQPPRTGNVDDYIAQAWKYRGMEDPSGGYITGAAGVSNLSRIPSISGLGTAKPGIGNQFTTNMNLNIDSMPLALQRSIDNPTYVDERSGMPVGQQFGPYQSENVNQPTTGQALNAPSSAGLSSVDWTIQNLSASPLGNQKNIGAFPQTNIRGITTQVGKLAQPYGWDQPDVRSVSELQSLVDIVNAEAAERGKKPVLFDKSMKKRVSDVRGTQEALNELKLTPVQGTALADALRQLELAQTGTAESYTSRAARMPQSEGINFNAPEAINPREGAAPIAKVSRGRTVDTPSGARTQISTAFKGLDDTEAAKPFIGAVGEEPPLTRQFGSSTPRYNTDAIGLREVREGDWYKKNQPTRKKVDGILKEKYNRKYQKARADNLETTRSRQVSSATAESRAREAEKRREKEEAILAPYRVKIGG